MGHPRERVCPAAGLIRQRRQDAGLDQAALAEKVGVSRWGINEGELQRSGARVALEYASEWQQASDAYPRPLGGRLQAPAVHRTDDE